MGTTASASSDDLRRRRRSQSQRAPPQPIKSPCALLVIDCQLPFYSHCARAAREAWLWRQLRFIGGRRCGVPQFQLPQRTPGQTRQARDGRRGPPGGAWAGPGAHCGVGPAWVLGLFVAETPIRGARWSAERHSLLSSSQVAKAPYCALLSAQPRPAAGRATSWPGPPSDRPPQSASVEEVSRLA